MRYVAPISLVGQVAALRAGELDLHRHLDAVLDRVEALDPTLRAAGALVLGKTHTAEFAYAAPGPTRNPHDPGHTPGGSSHGSAAGVAAGFFPLALGTQTIGSVIRPAAFCGVAGFVPSHGRVGAEGTLYVSRALDRIGLFAADPASMALAAATLVAGWRPAGPLPPPVLGVVDGPFLEAAEPAARELFERQVDALATAGYRVRRELVFEDAEEVAASLRRLMSGELAREHAALFERHRDRYRPQTAAGIEQGRTIPDAQLDADRRAALARRERVESQRLAAGVDVWVTPGALGPAPAGVGASGSPWLHLPWSYVGLPAAALPAGAIGALPVGLQLVGGWYADERLLAWAGAIARDVDFPSLPAAAHQPPPQSFSWT